MTITLSTAPPLPTDLPTHKAGFAPPADVNPLVVAQRWLSAVERAAITGDGELFADQFATDGFWRDILAFTNDFRAIRTVNIAPAASRVFPTTQARDFVFADTLPSMQSPFEGVTFLNVHFNFNTRVGPAYGVANLVFEEALEDWKAYTVFTLLEGVHGVKQNIGENRARGEHNTPLCYDDTRALESAFDDKDPEVLISEYNNWEAADIQLEPDTTASRSLRSSNRTVSRPSLSTSRFASATTGVCVTSRSRCTTQCTRATSPSSPSHLLGQSTPQPASSPTFWSRTLMSWS